MSDPEKTGTEIKSLRQRLEEREVYLSLPSDVGASPQGMLDGVLAAFMGAGFSRASCCVVQRPGFNPEGLRFTAHLDFQADQVERIQALITAMGAQPGQEFDLVALRRECVDDLLRETETAAATRVPFTGGMDMSSDGGTSDDDTPEPLGRADEPHDGEGSGDGSDGEGDSPSGDTSDDN